MEMEKNVNMDGAYWKKKIIHYYLILNIIILYFVEKNKNRSIIVYIHIQVILPYIL